MKASPLTAEWWYESTLSHYALHAAEPRMIAVYRGMLRHLADGDGALVVHCAAGKDRTGTACALVHHIAGVGHDDMVADFLLTNDEDRIHRRMKQAGDWVEQMTGRRPDDPTMRVAASVFPEYLDHFFATVRTEYGSVDGYLETVLGVDAAMQEKIRARLLD
jgi:protein tyrosine/serine phosphatase